MCGPYRATLQTGLYPTQTGCYRNGIALPTGFRTVADRFYDAGYDAAYVGKWHLASTVGLPGAPDVDFATRAVPPERRGGYRGFWRAADVLEFTSHGYDGYVYDESMNRVDFRGYRVDRVTDFALEYLRGYEGNKPFFLTISHIEPHHQNDRGHYEGPEGSKERFADFTLPGDLQALPGNAAREYPDYLGACRSLDDNLARVVALLKERGLYDDTVIVYVSDHGSHFTTRNRDAHKNGFDDYKRSCHDGCLRVPLVFGGGALTKRGRVQAVVSTVSLPKTLLKLAGVDVGCEMAGEDLLALVDGVPEGRPDRAFAQISESRVGRCLRTQKYKYAVYAPGKEGNRDMDAEVYRTDFLYDLEEDPWELNNLAESPAHAQIRAKLAAELLQEMRKAGERPGAIVP